MSKIIFENRASFGKDRYYPMSEEAKKLLALFSHGRGERLTLTQSQIDVLREIGISLVLR